MVKTNYAEYIRQETITGTVPMVAKDRQYSFWTLKVHMWRSISPSARC